MIAHIRQFIRVLGPHANDRSTLQELDRMLEDRRSWWSARELFHRIREKTLKAERAADGLAGAQYCFEELCAKTLCNLSGRPAPYDPDSPYYIIPAAVAWARRVGVDPAEILRIIIAEP